MDLHVLCLAKVNISLLNDAMLSGSNKLTLS